MTDKVQVDRAYLEGLEQLHKACLVYENRYPHSVNEALKAVPPKPEELIQMDEWKASVVGVYGYGILWCREDMRIFGPTRTTEDEAKRAANAMLREIAGKVKP